MSDLAIEMHQVEKHYPYFTLDRIDLTLQRGQIMGFIGANGAGKSTTIRILMAMIRHDAGEVKVLGCPIPAQQVVAKWDIGYATEDMRLYKHATLDWHMRYIASIYPGWDQGYAKRLLKQFDLIPEQKVKGLAHGQRVKANMLLVLARRPKLLILDEPTVGLDPVARQEVIAELMEVLADEERSVLFSSQNTLDVEQLSDQITFVDRGRIVDSRDKESFLERWRRLRVVVEPDMNLPRLPGIVDVKVSGRGATITVNEFHPDLTAAFEQAGAMVRKVETMTLEEIFVANVMANRRKHSDE
jgi:ABC-2 type transport system ATP-binding protein